MSGKTRLALISSISSIMLGGIIALVSTFSFVIDLLATQNPVAILIDLVVMTISYLTVWQGIYYTIVERIAKEKMEQEWDNRIAPVINLITETSGRIASIEDEMMKMNLKVDNTLNYVTRSQDMDPSRMYILPGASFKFISKILVLIFFTFSALVYVSSYPLGIVHYFIMAIYLVWWFVITSEYKLFGSTTAWIWGIAPVLTIPTVGIILSAIYGLNIMIGILFLGLFLYVYLYYTWGCYVATGFKILDLKPIAYMLRKKLKADAPIDGKEFREWKK